MLLVPTELRPSPIHGIGVFLLAPVKKGEMIWHFDSRIDRAYTETEIQSLPALAQKFIKKYTSLDQETGLWVYCGDDARFFNHSYQPSTLSLGIGFADDVAAQDLVAGEELTSDYRTICDITRLTGEL